MTRRGTSRIISLGASLALTLGIAVIGAGPAAAEQDTASDVPTLTSVGVGSATDTESGDIQGGEEPITFADVFGLLDQLHDDGQVTLHAFHLLHVDLLIAEYYFLFDDGQGCSIDVIREHFFEQMEMFKQTASDPRNVLTESAREELVAAADQLIELCGAFEASG